MDTELEPIALGIQLAAAAGLVLVLTIVHAMGLVGISRLLNLRDDRLKDHAFDYRAIGLMCGMAVLLFLLHVFEIFIFAVFFVAVDAMPVLEEALYYSASAYATLGRTAEFFPDEWRLIGAFEALIGFLLIGWSTAFIVSNVNQLRP